MPGINYTERNGVKDFQRRHNFSGAINTYLQAPTAHLIHIASKVLRRRAQAREMLGPRSNELPLKLPAVYRPRRIRGKFCVASTDRYIPSPETERHYQRGNQD